MSFSIFLLRLHMTPHELLMILTFVYAHVHTSRLTIPYARPPPLKIPQVTRSRTRYNVTIVTIEKPIYAY
jgi:hypothetical protein